MMSVFPIVALLALAIGLALAVIGWRGRKIDDHPVCRKCRFDLAGVYPANKTCPECGRDLAGERSVRIGNRRKRRLPLGVGAGLLAVALIFGGLFVTVLVGGPALNPYKPMWLLGIEARSASATRASDALDELMSRYDDDELSQSQVDRMVTLALDEHADENDPNGQQWIDAIEMLIGGSELSKAEMTRYLDQGLILKIRLRPRVRIGDRIPIEIFTTNARVGPTLMVSGIFKDVKLGGRPMTGGIRDIFARARGATARLTSNTMTYSIAPQPGVAAGPTELTATLAIQIRGRTGLQSDESSVYRADIERRVSIPIEFTDGDTVRLVIPSENQREAVLDAVEGDRLEIRDSGSRADVYIRSSNLTIGGVFRIFLRAENGSLIETAVMYSPTPSPITLVTGRGGKLPSIDALEGAKTVDVILRPDPEAAAQTVDRFEIYGEEIVLEDVPIQRIPDPGSGP